jgi:hypothetical protein
MGTTKYKVTIEFTPNKKHNSPPPERVYVKTPIGNMLSPQLSQVSLIHIHDMALMIDDVIRLGDKGGPVNSTHIINTEYGSLVIKIKKVNSLLFIIKKLFGKS